MSKSNSMWCSSLLMVPSPEESIVMKSFFTFLAAKGYRSHVFWCMWAINNLNNGNQIEHAIFYLSRDDYMIYTPVCVCLILCVCAKLHSRELAHSKSPAAQCLVYRATSLSSMCFEQAEKKKRAGQWNGLREQVSLDTIKGENVVFFFKFVDD